MKDEVKRFRTFLAEPIVDAMADEKINRIIVRGREFELVRHGKWIDCTSSDHWKCSKCGYKAPLWWDGEKYEEWLSQYCPQCGTEMDAKEESDEADISGND